jgi:hypothetical protein
MAPEGVEGRKCWRERGGVEAWAGLTKEAVVHRQAPRSLIGEGGRRERPGEKDTESSWSAPVG